MELMAINHALDHPNMNHATIYSDSAYAILCLTTGRRAWAKSNWKTPLGEPVKNRELIMEIGEKIDSKKFVKLVKVKAHVGDVLNAVVDRLATDLSKKMMLDPDLKDGEHPILFT
jgi:ribonuclease HI